MKKQLGFTLIEMMAVLGVITILALMALPSYLDRIMRAQIEESLTLADIAKKPIAAAWTSLQMFPDDNAAAALPPPEKIVSNYVTSLTVDHGAIHLVFSDRANTAIHGKTLTLRPAVVEDAPVVPIAWICGYADAPEKMVAQGQNRTNVPKQLLPMSCRGSAQK
jgi:type IV pilus assembly protein PilA